MNAYGIATLPWRGQTSPHINEFIEYVRTTDDPDVLGLTEMMAKELQSRRHDREYGGYMGGDSTNLDECRDDARLLLARVLLDKSSSHETLPTYLKHQLNNEAYSIYESKKRRKRYQNPVDDWVEAERGYVSRGLAHLIWLRELAETTPRNDEHT